ncbi:MAG: hypothetical protein PHG40_00880 [Candidatus Omnitrophica bacterium]|nr:hypothetical protein [Candidatus Omnitrophota bacterium]
MRGIIIFFIFIILSTVNFAYAESQADKLELIDKQDNPNIIYKSNQYQLIIDKLKEYTTATSEEEITALIFKVYSDLENKSPGLTIYEVAEEIKKTAGILYDQDGGKKQDIRNMAAFYMTTK